MSLKNIQGISGQVLVIMAQNSTISTTTNSLLMVLSTLPRFTRTHSVLRKCMQATPSTRTLCQMIRAWSPMRTRNKCLEEHHKIQLQIQQGSMDPSEAQIRKTKNLNPKNEKKNQASKMTKRVMNLKLMNWVKKRRRNQSQSNQTKQRAHQQPNFQTSRNQTKACKAPKTQPTGQRGDLTRHQCHRLRLRERVMEPAMRDRASIIHSRASWTELASWREQKIDSKRREQTIRRRESQSRRVTTAQNLSHASLQCSAGRRRPMRLAGGTLWIIDVDDQTICISI